MSPGEGAGRFLGDLANGTSDQIMRTRWQEGHYGTGKDQPRAKYIAGWRQLAGRRDPKEG